jgi:threonine/homoserine/homoserine lactone efflux protein
VNGTGTRVLTGVLAALVAIYAIHWVIEVISIAAIGVMVFSGYHNMRAKIQAEKQKTLAVQAELDTAKRVLEQNGLVLSREGVPRPFLDRAR